MTRTLAGGIAAATFALGILTGAAGTVIARDVAPSSDLTAVMAEHMNGQGMAGMTSMMGGGSMMGPGASEMPGGQHDQHHATPTPEASK